MQGHVRMDQQERPDRLGLVRRQVIGDDVNLASPWLAGDKVAEELDERRAGVAGHRVREHGPRLGVERREQGERAVPVVFEAVPLGAAGRQRQDRIEAVQRLNAVFSSTAKIAAWSGGFQRESNTVVSVLLQELEWYNGVVILPTNLAANFDPAFERRIRTHVLFEMPGEAERAQIWRVQLHPARTPLAADVDLQALARRYEVSGGDIRNAVLKAALAAAAEPGPDSAKRIHQHHFEASIEDVIAGKRVMRQSLFANEPLVLPEANLVAGATASHPSPLVAYTLAGAALLVALIALAVALLK